MNLPQPNWSRAAGLALGGAVISAQLAWTHMLAVWRLGEICGRSPSLHCGWCGSALALAALSIALYWRGRTEASPAPARRRAD